MAIMTDTERDIELMKQNCNIVALMRTNLNALDGVNAPQPFDLAALVQRVINETFPKYFAVGMFDRFQVMNLPAGLVVYNNGVHPVVAKTQAIHTQLELTGEMDLDHTVERLSDELTTLYDEAINAGDIVLPYIPLQPINFLNPNTFQPLIGFKTRYARFHPQV